jgi:hypothetical protein
MKTAVHPSCFAPTIIYHQAKTHAQQCLKIDIETMHWNQTLTCKHSHTPCFANPCWIRPTRA